MSLRNEFPVTLPSNVTGLDTNTPGAYQTTLSYPHEQPGTWNVALIDITYPHTWLDLDKECVISISTLYDQNNQENINIIGEANSMEIVKLIRNVESYQKSTNEKNQYRDPVGR